jgi:carbamoyl-phosphate synthase small subunit
VVALGCGQPNDVVLLRMQVVAYDFGIKHNILRRLASFGCKLTVVPADYPASKVLEMNPDGVFLSNGPVSPRLSFLQG